MLTLTNTVPVEMIAVIRARLAKFIERMNRRDIAGDGPVVTFTDERIVKIDDHVSIKVVDATITLPLLVTEHGWTFVAALDHVAGAVVVRSLPGSDVEVPTWVYDVEPGRCDHCHTDRRRNTSYLIVREGSFKVVGSSCVDDFMGHSATAIIALHVAFGGLLDDDEGVRPSRYLSTIDVLNATALVVSIEGRYVKSSDLSKTPTASIVRDILYRGLDRDWKALLRDQPVYGVQRDALVAETLAGIEELDERDTWSHDIRALNAAGVVTEKHLNLYVSAITIGLRRVRANAERTARRNEWLGAVGEKITVDASVTGIKYIDGYYGTTILYTFTTPAGELVKWFSSRDQHLDEHAAVRVSGTVKAQDEYNGRKATNLTRCRVDRL